MCKLRGPPEETGKIKKPDLFLCHCPFDDFFIEPIFNHFTLSRLQGKIFIKDCQEKSSKMINKDFNDLHGKPKKSENVQPRPTNIKGFPREAFLLLTTF